MITVLACHFSENLYGWMIAVTVSQDLAVTAFIFSRCGR